MNLLLIEDNSGDARLLQEMLTKEKFINNVECVNRLNIGFNRLEKGGIDAILLDLGLPDSQGIETFEKTYAAAPDVPILILTSNNDDLLALEAVRKGAQDYLIKGKTDGTMLLRAINYAVERKKVEEKLRVHSNVDIIDSGKEYIVKAELPGMKKEDVEIQLGMNLMWIFGKAPEQVNEAGQVYFHKAIALPVYRKSIEFSEGVDIDKASAMMSEGLLKVILPKLESEPEKRSRKITPQ
jgi:HSP20 family molecular chaperone IbpA